MLAEDNWIPFFIFVVLVCLIFPAAMGIFVGIGAYLVFRYVILNIMG